jgi:hypothetical protein
VALAEEASMDSGMRVRLSAAVATVLFLAGYLLTATIPGGGTIDPQEFVDFYGDDGQRMMAFYSAMLMVAASLAVIWCFTELRAYGASMLVAFAHAAAIAGAAGLAAGAAILGAPAGVQSFGEAEFVGVPIAHTMSQAGYGVMLFGGMGSLGVATVTMSLGLARSAAIPSWLGWVGVALGVIVALGSLIWLPGLLFAVWLLLVAVIGVRGAATAPAR